MAKQSLEQTLEALVEKLTPVVRDAFLAAIADVSDETILKDLIAAIERQDYQGAFEQLGMSQASMRPLTRALEATFEQGGIAFGQTFPKIIQTNAGRAVFRFDVRNERAEKWIKDQSGSLITRIQEDARVNIRNVMQVGLEAGNNPRLTALDIVGRVNTATGKREGGIIGLTQPQELSVRNARKNLIDLDPQYFSRLRRDKRFDGIVQRAIETKTPLTAVQIDKLVTRYKDSLLQLRGEGITRTETIQSLNRSQFEAITQASDLGAMKKNQARKEWDTAGDNRVRHDHALMDGQVVNFNEPFIAPDGSLMMFPGDISLGASAKQIINCRCRMKLKIDWLQNID